VRMSFLIPPAVISSIRRTEKICVFHIHGFSDNFLDITNGFLTPFLYLVFVFGCFPFCDHIIPYLSLQIPCKPEIFISCLNILKIIVSVSSAPASAQLLIKGSCEGSVQHRCMCRGHRPKLLRSPYLNLLRYLFYLVFCVF
jgi:hypothetical protein